MVDLVKLGELASKIDGLCWEDFDSYPSTSERFCRDCAAALSEAKAEIERLREALNLAANRLDRLTLECDMTKGIYYDAKDWTKEARAAVTGEST